MHAIIVSDTLRRVFGRDDGQDLLEYALLVALIALVAFGAVQTVGTTINSVFWDYIATATDPI